MNQHLTICTTRSTSIARTRINSSRVRKVLIPFGSRVLKNESYNLLFQVNASDIFTLAHSSPIFAIITASSTATNKVFIIVLL
jgi:hypothetical protein